MRWRMMAVSWSGMLFSSLAPAAPPAHAKPAQATDSAASFQCEAGLGGGSSGWAARLAVELDYWFLQDLGAGAGIAYTGQVALSETNVVIVGPALAWRSELDQQSFFGSATLGYAEGSVTQRSLLSYCLADECPPRAPTRLSVRGLAGSANAGLAWPVGDAQFGTALTVDWIPSSIEAGFAATVSVMIGSPLR
jgi:hypothetical protein